MKPIAHVARFGAVYGALVAVLIALGWLGVAGIGTGVVAVAFACCVGGTARALLLEARGSDIPRDRILRVWLGITAVDVLVQLAVTAFYLASNVPNPGLALLFALGSVLVVHGIGAWLLLRHARRWLPVVGLGVKQG